MDWLHQLQFDSERRLTQTGLPRRLVRHLVLSHEALVGTRVLDAGCGTGGLVHFFDQLGLNACGIDESPERVASASDAAPYLDFRSARVDEMVPCPAHRFDLVLVRDLKVHEGSLFSLPALRATANLLASLRPGGHLVFVVRLGSVGLAEPAGHEVACYEQHLACFPGERETAGFPDGTAVGGALRWLPGHRLRSGHATVATRIPAEPLMRADWLRLAERGTATHRTACCLRPGS